jgi:hypothetical protein
VKDWGVGWAGQGNVLAKAIGDCSKEGLEKVIVSLHCSDSVWIVFFFIVISSCS